jgi:hypothetical protein
MLIEMKLTCRDSLFHTRIYKKKTDRQREKERAGSIDRFCN